MMGGHSVSAQVYLGPVYWIGDCAGRWWGIVIVYPHETVACQGVVSLNTFNLGRNLFDSCQVFVALLQLRTNKPTIHKDGVIFAHLCGSLKKLTPPTRSTFVLSIKDE